MKPDEQERDRLQRAYNALCGAEHDLEAIYPALTIKHELAGLRKRLGVLAFPGVASLPELEAERPEQRPGWRA